MSYTINSQEICAGEACFLWSSTFEAPISADPSDGILGDTHEMDRLTDHCSTMRENGNTASNRCPELLIQSAMEGAQNA